MDPKLVKKYFPNFCESIVGSWQVCDMPELWQVVTDRVSGDPETVISVATCPLLLYVTTTPGFALERSLPWAEAPTEEVMVTASRKKIAIGLAGRILSMGDTSWYASKHMCPIPLAEFGERVAVVPRPEW